MRAFDASVHIRLGYRLPRPAKYSRRLPLPFRLARAHIEERGMFALPRAGGHDVVQARVVVGQRAAERAAHLVLVA